MNFKMLGRFIAQIVSIEALFMIPALLISLGYGEMNAVLAFLYTMGIMLVVAGILYLLCHSTGKLFGAREGLVCVGLSWGVMSLLGCLPFVFSGSIPSYVDALFEMVSGFTTTGASILTDVECLPRGILYWRSFSHWVGGMGVLVFLLALSPSGSGKGFTMHLLRAESPGPDVGKLAPKMRTTAMILYVIYIAMTVLNFIFLLFGHMDWLEALCTALGTAGTGGFGVRNDSMASFSPYIQNVTTVFMFLFGINFSCYYLLLIGSWRSVFKDEELRLYIIMAVGVVALIAFNVRHLYGTWEETIRHSAFQVSSIITTTGYGTSDFNLWPMFSKTLIMLLMITGACAGSTCGGLKLTRVLLLFKGLRRNIRQVMNPRKVQVVRINGKVVNETVMDNVNAYLAAYVIIIIVCFIAISLDGLSVEANLTAVLSCFNNIGPGLAEVGPTSNYSCFSDLSTFLLTVAMLAGRLEIFPILVLFSRATWSRK
jgi:trk system potassium uptake protein TrkH